MEAQLRIQPGVVDGIADSIGKHQGEIETILGALKALNGDLNAAWDGSAQVAFDENYGDWIINLENYIETLSSVQAYLRSVVANYVELDAAARAAASSAAAPI